MVTQTQTFGVNGPLVCASRCCSIRPVSNAVSVWYRDHVFGTEIMCLVQRSCVWHRDHVYPFNCHFLRQKPLEYKLLNFKNYFHKFIILSFYLYYIFIFVLQL